VESPFRRFAFPLFPRRVGTAVLVALLSVSSVGCFGRFAVTRKIYDWNEHISGDKWVRSLVFVLIVPIYGLVNIFDAFFANVVEFWSGHNPMASIPGTERWAYGSGGEAARMTLRGDGAIDVLVTAPDRPAKRFTLMREGNDIALLDASGVETARAGAAPDGTPALLETSER
jgi:hypothetical protein